MPRPCSQGYSQSSRAAGDDHTALTSQCTALSKTGDRCKRPTVPGLTVCALHGGGTAASQRQSRRKAASSTARGLWDLGAAGSIDVLEELNKLINQKITDITALRIRLGEDPDAYHGMLDDTVEVVENEQNGTTVRTTQRMGVHPLVTELHTAERELNTMLRLLNEISPQTSVDDIDRIRLQTARETARIMRAYPGISIDQAAAEALRAL